MTRSLLALVLVAAAAGAASAQVVQSAAVCRPNPELDQKTFALWIMPGVNPDAAPCAARLSLASCAPVMDGGESRIYASADGSYAVILNVAGDGGVTVTLQLVGAAGIGHGAVTLATYPYQRVFYRGIGADAVQVADADTGSSRTIGNVMLIPAENLTANGQAMCPAR
ncbi:MAG: hypothetical protein KGM24_02005 [Elusimicrobia bacterium]|nr:hypothetical protein [Elusimicrobiota bacterium]